MGFKGRPAARRRADTVELMYRDLPRSPRDAVPGLWLHQGDVLRAFAADAGSSRDLALELPTGTGKTLVGLLAAEWSRQGGNGPVAYACPTNQLVGQVLATGRREGVPVVELTGSWREWDASAVAAYEAGESVAVTNFSTVFNSNPQLEQPAVLIFDDAHAGEQYVGEHYAVQVRRKKDREGYLAVLASLGGLVPDLVGQRLADDEDDPGAGNHVRMVFPSLDAAVLRALDVALSGLAGKVRHQVSMIRSSLPACLVYVAHDAIEVRPVLPPTFQNPVFADAGQRVYLSATLGAGGELERAFGVRDIVRLAPAAAGEARSGRRLFVFADMVAGEDADGIVSSVVARTAKALVLTQAATEQAEAVAAVYAPPGVPVLGRASVLAGLAAFAAAPTGILGLSNRYDGLDLPGDDCRVVVLSGLPTASTLQERWLTERVAAASAVAQRVRGRVVQGAGRCARGPDDFSVVVVRGIDACRYLNRPETRGALEPEMRAEVEFGWTNSLNVDRSDVLENVRVFLEHDEEWRAGGEPIVTAMRADAPEAAVPGATGMQGCVAEEVSAWQLACQGQWTDAAAHAREAARLVGAGGDSTRGYRSLLLWLAGAWLALGSGDTTSQAGARQLVREASAASTRSQWIHEAGRLPDAPAPELAAADQVAVAAIVARLGGALNRGKATKDLDVMVAGLSDTPSGPYEQALALLGGYLGAQSSKPPGDGRCDSAWEWGAALWTTVEAKSEEGGQKEIPLKDVRQANTQLDQLAGDRGVPNPPAGSPAVLVTERLTISADTANAAAGNLYLSSPAEVLALAKDVRDAWTRLLAATSPGASPRFDDVLGVLSQSGCLPTQAVERLTTSPVRPTL